MPEDRLAVKAKRMEEAGRIIKDARLHWLQQLLDWPLGAGSLANRLIEAEVAALRKAVEGGTAVSRNFGLILWARLAETYASLSGRMRTKTGWRN